MLLTLYYMHTKQSNLPPLFHVCTHIHHGLESLPGYTFLGWAEQVLQSARDWLIYSYATFPAIFNIYMFCLFV